MTELSANAPELETSERTLVGPRVVSGSARRDAPVRRLAIVVSAIVSALLAGIAARSFNVEPVNATGWGLLTALPTLYWIAFAAAMAVTAFVIWEVERSGKSVLSVLVPLWIAVVHLAPSLADQGSPGKTVTVGDESSDFPVSLAASVGSVMNESPASQQTLEWTIRLWPVLVTALVAVLVYALASRSFPRTPKAGPLAALVYVMISWPYAGELSSSGAALVMLMALLVLIETGPLQVELGPIGRVPFLARQAESVGDRPDSYSIDIFVALALTAFGIIAVDSFMPAAVCSSFLVLAAYGRRVAWRLWLLSLIGFTVWGLLVGRPWWTNRLVELPEGLERLASLIVGSDAEIVLQDQILAWGGLVVTAFVIVCSVLMTGKRFSGLRPTVPLVPLAVAAVLATSVTYSTQSLGVQVFVLISPFAAVLAGRALSSFGRPATTVLVPVLVALAFPLAVVVRFHGAAESQAAEAILVEMNEPGLA